MLHQNEIKFEEVVAAYFSCRKNKRMKKSSLHFEMNLEDNLRRLYKELISGQYKIGKSVCFVVHKPKNREVWCSEFKDRIVHHLVYSRLSAYWNSRFIKDSCACIPNRGTLYSIHRLEKHVRSFTNNWNKKGYFLKCDLSNFFVSINREIVWEILSPTIKEDWVKRLAHQIVFNDPTVNYKVNSSKKEMASVPRRKRLLLAKGGTGLPIGNLMSQFLANVLLHKLDCFIKHKLKVKKYIRYVDDFVILGDSTEYLNCLYKRILEFTSSIGVALNPRKCYMQSTNRGITFVGFTIFPHHTVVSSSTVGRIFQNLNESSKSLENYKAFVTQAKNGFTLANMLEQRYRRNI